mmetsp:Transcript_81445/g.242734  ORF Transcript_81445/g.242734 Transcript_81445/m.242734 type:complete len:220 (+) Transcript_81445:233-892(+)
MHEEWQGLEQARQRQPACEEREPSLGQHHLQVKAQIQDVAQHLRVPLLQEGLEGRDALHDEGEARQPEAPQAAHELAEGRTRRLQGVAPEAHRRRSKAHALGVAELGVLPGVRAQDLCDLQPDAVDAGVTVEGAWDVPGDQARTFGKAFVVGDRGLLHLRAGQGAREAVPHRLQSRSPRHLRRRSKVHGGRDAPAGGAIVALPPLFRRGRRQGHPWGCW